MGPQNKLQFRAVNQGDEGKKVDGFKMKGVHARQCVCVRLVIETKNRTSAHSNTGLPLPPMRICLWRRALYMTPQVSDSHTSQG